MSPTARSRQTSGLRVLVVDDDRRVRAAMTAELTALGLHPTATGPASPPDPHRLSAGEYVDLDAGLDADFDVALVDVAIPSVTAGLTLIEDLAERLPVVAFSINGAAREAAFAAGATAYLEKDGDTHRLLCCLHAAATTPPTAAGGPHRPRSSR